MAALDRVIAVAVLSGGSLLAACASSPPAPPAHAPEPQTVTAPPSPPQPGTEEPVGAKIRSSEPVVIDEGGADSGAQGLVAAAAAERERRRTAPASVVVINNKNLAQHATGKLTVSGVAPSTTAAPPAATDTTKDETYWRERVRGLREQWAAAVDSIGELEARAAGLRTRFYAEDDPYVRDGQIKPAWDRALEQLETSRESARSLEDRLAATLEEGRQAGALPGWLRDGIELEPIERPYQAANHPVAHDDGNLVREPEELGEPPHR
jgi:hypothetical protein